MAKFLTSPVIPDASAVAQAVPYGQGNLTYAPNADTLALERLERETARELRRYAAQSNARVADATVVTDAWTSTSAWTGTGTVASGRMYSSAGLTKAVPAGSRWVMRATMHSTGSSSKYSYFGVGSSTAAADLVGIGQGSASAAAAILRGTNISAGNLTIPRTLPTLSAGDYLCTVARDETTVSFTIQSTTGGQTVYGARVPVSAFPGGVVSTVFISANDTTGGGQNWGPLVSYSELAIPPVWARTVGGVALFGANKPLSFWRADASTGIGHIISVPGDSDPRVPSPMVLFLHQASTGLAHVPWSEARMANVTSALETAGYVIAASDNGPAITAGGTQDKFGNQAGQDDYAALVLWCRQHLNTGALMLLGPSQGSFFAQSILAARKIGGISAVASISGGSDLALLESDPTWQSLLWTAYGAVSTPDFTTKVVGYNPIANPGYQFRGVPQRFYEGSTDTTSPPTTQLAPFITKITPYVPEASVVSLAVGHLDSTLYQGSDLVSFFSTYVTAPAAAGTQSAQMATQAVVDAAITTAEARANHTGTQSADTLTDGTTNKAFLATERTKLTGIATAATANDTDANLKARANHTGTQTASTISDLATAAMTFSNKRINRRFDAVVSTPTWTLDADAYDTARISAQSQALVVANPTGTPTSMQSFILRIKDNGTARAITYGSQFRAFGAALPTTTVVSKTVYLGFIWNAEDTKWDCIANSPEV